jgi:hypothetical protein
MSERSTTENDAPCGGERRSRADWMGSDQYETCLCVRPKGHAGPHACDHDNPPDAIRVFPPGNRDTEERA